MTAALDATVFANRFGLGATPTELAELGNNAREVLAKQLQGPPPLLAGDLPGSQQIIIGSLALRDKPAQPEGGVVAVAMRLGQYARPIYVAEAQARFAAAVDSPSSLLERLTHFWGNHFAVSVDKLAVLGLAGAFEREAIRPHILGKFDELLLAVERHPAMLLYLDNQQSVGPHSPAIEQLRRRTGRAAPGLNENLGREILELHTLGVAGGYSQQDVTTLSAMITGWSLGGAPGRLGAAGEPGVFVFREALHEPGPKTLLGKVYREEGQRQGEQALRDLARQPATAWHLARKLAQHFIADEPPAAVVDSVARAYLDHDTDLRATYTALFARPEAWEPSLRKFKTPADYLHSAWRALQLPAQRRPAAQGLLQQLGQRTYQPGSPAGWPDRSGDWDSASALLKRVELANATGQQWGSRINAQTLAEAVLGASLSTATRSAIARAQDAAQALTLLLAAPEFMRR